VRINVQQRKRILSPLPPPAGGGGGGGGGLRWRWGWWITAALGKRIAAVAGHVCAIGLLTAGVLAVGVVVAVDVIAPILATLVVRTRRAVKVGAPTAELVLFTGGR